MIYKRNRFLLLLLLAAVVCGGLGSCTKNFKTMNTTSLGSPYATVAQLYVAFVSNMAQGDQQVSYNSWTYPITQQGVVYTKADYVYGNDGSEYWTNFYYNLSNYEAMMNVIASEPDTTIYTNVKAMMKVLRGYMAIKLSNFYGDMPYSQAGGAINYTPTNDTVLTPAYDKQKSIYLSVLTDLTWAVNNFSTASTQYSLGSSDLILKNNITDWIEFANTLRLRIALTMYTKDQADATPIIADALTKPLLDADYANVGMWPTNIPSMNLAARLYSFGTECRLRMGTTMWELMSSTNAQDGSGIFDPRCNIFFEPNNDTLWNPFPQNPTSSTPAEEGSPYDYSIRSVDWANKDGDPPTPNLYANFNFYWSADDSIPELFMTAAEAHFLKAEVYALGLGGTAVNMTTAQTEYNAGITSSVIFWTQRAISSAQWVVNKPAALPSATTINTFLANPVVAFSAATAAKQIYAQEWIDLFRQPWDAWTLMKRTGGLTPQDATNAAFYTTTYGSYNRYQYPTSEQTYNYANWYTETGGNDLTSTKIWIQP